MAHEPIIFNKWPTLAEYQWSEGELPPDKSVVHVYMEQLFEFFKALEGSTNKYILITGSSDYGIIEQKRWPVWHDANVWMHGFVIVNENIGYNDIVIPARCDKTKCNIDDKYSIKMYSYTGATFDKIPDNIVLWFCVNNDLNDDRIEHIPFGLPEWTSQLIEKAREKVDSWPERDIDTYVNFQPNTTERARLLQECQNIIVDKDEKGFLKEIPHADYVQRLLHSKAVLCPEGNGRDGFRIAESISLGAVPIIVTRQDANWIKPYIELNARVVTLDGICLNGGGPVKFDLTGTSLDLNMWREKVRFFKEVFL